MLSLVGGLNLGRGRSVNLYLAGAILGATTAVAVSAVWIYGSGGGLTGFAVQHPPTHPLDIQMAPYLAKSRYDGGLSALVPVSVAFRVNGKTDGMAFCKDLIRIQKAINEVLRREIGSAVSRAAISHPSLKQRLMTRVNEGFSAPVVREVHLAIGDSSLGDKPTTCGRLARMK